MRLTAPLMTTILLLMVLTGCNETPKPCPKQIYPSLEAIDKIPRIKLTIKNGTMTQHSTKNAFKTIKALRVSENYYWTLIARYRKDFL